MTFDIYGITSSIISTVWRKATDGNSHFVCRWHLGQRPWGAFAARVGVDAPPPFGTTGDRPYPQLVASRSLHLR